MIAIDPGYARSGSGSACARFDEQAVLREVWYDRPETARRRFTETVSLIVWECPQVDRRTRVSAPSVVRLAAEGGTLAGIYAGATGARVVAVTPTEWKGSEPKPIAHWRMWAVLSAEERALLGGSRTLQVIDLARRTGARDRWGKAGAAYYRGPGAKVHNLLDAVGIGLWRLGR